MKIFDHCVIYTADDEEPDCLMCDYCQSSDLCSECGPEHWWHYYEREEQNSENEQTNHRFKKIRLKEVNYDKQRFAYV